MGGVAESAVGGAGPTAGAGAGAVTAGATAIEGAGVAEADTGAVGADTAGASPLHSNGGCCDCCVAVSALASEPRLLPITALKHDTELIRLHSCATGSSALGGTKLVVMPFSRRCRSGQRSSAMVDAAGNPTKTKLSNNARAHMDALRSISARTLRPKSAGRASQVCGIAKGFPSTALIKACRRCSPRC